MLKFLALNTEAVRASMTRLQLYQCEPHLELCRLRFFSVILLVVSEIVISRLELGKQQQKQFTETGIRYRSLRQ
jgi:hypothetical protein